MPLVIGDCTTNVSFKDPEIGGTTINENQAVVLLQVSGQWKEIQHDSLGMAFDLMYFGDPCAGFHSRQGIQNGRAKDAVHEV